MAHSKPYDYLDSAGNKHRIMSRRRAIQHHRREINAFCEAIASTQPMPSTNFLMLGFPTSSRCRLH